MEVKEMLKISITPQEERPPFLSTLKDLVGLPARITFHDERSPQGSVKIPGTIRQVSTSGITMDLFFALLTPHLGVPVVLEIMTKDALLQCCSLIQHSPNPLTVHLNYPTDLHATQRRRFPRARVSVETNIAASHQSNEGATITNLSVGGCAVLVADRYPVGSIVTLTLQATGLLPADVQGEVVRCTLSPKGLWEIGVSFQNLSADQEQQLARYVSMAEQA
jgi:hypothetical protein